MSSIRVRPAKLKRKRLGVMEVGLAGRVSERPIAEPTMLVFYDGAKPEPQRDTRISR
jgi:hypothetical protein